MSQKNEKPEVFTIDLGFSDGDIPGVTMLLNPAKRQADAAASGAPAVKNQKFEIEPTKAVETAVHSVATSTATPTPSILGKESLKDHSVLFEVKFSMQNGAFRFQQATPHAEAFLQSWQQEIFNQMKFDVEAISFRAPFQELRYETFGFLYSIFGAQSSHFIQVVQAPSAPYLHVLVSNRSLLSQKDKILSILHSPPAETASDDVIELDLTG